MLMAFSLLCQSLLGLAALALAMDRHHETLARRWRGRRARRVLRVVGVVSLAASLACALVDGGGSQGLLLWLGVLTLSALAVVGWLAGIARSGASPSDAHMEDSPPGGN